MNPALTRALAVAAPLAALAYQGAGEFADFAGRILPVLGFVAFMAVVVNAADSVGTFEVLLGKMRAALKITGRTRRDAVLTWCLIFLASAVSTIFFSLDTTAILLTPLALKLAASAGLSPLRAALTVVWTANLGSMLLPISNLTNLLAVQTGLFHGTADYVQASWKVSAVLLIVAALAPWLVPAGDRAAGAADTGAARWTRGSASFAALLSVLLVALLLPVPVWVSAGVAAAVAVALMMIGVWDRSAIQWSLVPWSSLALTLALTATATLVHRLGLLDSLLGGLASLIDAPFHLFAFSAAGAGLANVANNIPAYLALEPATTTQETLLALLVGVNAGPVITPWASLATLIWAAQARRQGVRISWGRYVAYGAVLAPVSVALATAVI